MRRTTNDHGCNSFSVNLDPTADYETTKRMAYFEPAIAPFSAVEVVYIDGAFYDFEAYLMAAQSLRRQHC